MNTVRKEIGGQREFRVIRGKKRDNKRIDRFFALVLMLIGVAVACVESDLTVALMMLFISFPLAFGKKRFVEL